MGDALRSTPQSPYAETWLSTEDVAELLGLAPRTVRAQLARWVTRQSQRDGTGGVRHEILLSSLPIEAISKWEAHEQARLIVAPPSEADLVVSAYERATPRTRAYFDRWSQVLLATEQIQGRKALESWVERWNLTHPGEEVSVQSLYRVRAQVQEYGRVSLLQRDAKLPESTVRDDWFKDFCLAYLNENKISLPKAWITTRGLAEMAAEESRQAFDASSFPSASAFMRRLEREVSPAIISLKRNGEKKFFDNHGYYIERDYSAMVSGRVWVGDSRIQDFMVKVEGLANPIRPWLTLFICMKSYVPMGWHLHHTSPSAEQTMRALRNGLVRMGRPDWWYLDNGRENRNREVTGMTRKSGVDYDLQHTGSIAAQLGIQVHFAEAKRSRAKPIERQFKEMKGIIDRFWPTFCGGSTAEKPNRLKEILKGGDLPTLDQIRSELDLYLSETIPQIPCHGKTHKGRTRDQVLQADYAIHGPLPHISEDTASLLVSKMATGSIGRRGFRLSDLDYTWWGEWMPEHKGRRVVMRYDPDNLRVAHFYEATDKGHGKLVGIGQLVPKIGALVAHDDAVSLAEVARQNRRYKHEVKQGRELFPQAGAKDFERLREGLRRGYGSSPLDLPKSNTTILTPFDAAAAKIRRDEKAGRADLRIILQDEPPQQPKQPLIWLEGQISAAG